MSEVMKGFPPSPENQVTLANWREPPLNRWAFRHVSQIVPCAMVWCGEAGGRTVVPADWIRDIVEGGDPETWTGGSFDRDMPDTWYRSKWYKHGADVHALGGFGIYGQAIYVHPVSRTVIAKCSSQPRALDWGLEAMQRAAFLAIASELG